tara:strand:+ start:603 stop:1388 length:786 start_codon:yes stop_codon:yes gene_type:complete
MIKFPETKKISDIKKFFRKKGLAQLVNAADEKPLKVNELKRKKTYKPELTDLYNLYQFIIKNKRITSLEFGCGWSSLIIALALRENKKFLKRRIKNLRRNNLFQNFIVDNEKKYIHLAKERIKRFDKNLLKDSFFLYSQAQITQYDFRYVTEYKQIPKINPDFIYLDGPDQFKISSNKKFNINHKDLAPMAADILKIEFFLNPGTIILIDGRALNCNFLIKYLKRKWIYKYLKSYDQHILYLNDHINGVHSRNLINFFNKK